MDGRFLPEHPFFASPWWINFFENPGLAQFDHRIGAYVIALTACIVWWNGSRHQSSAAVRVSAHAILFLVLFQIALGIVTLLNQAPLPLSALHQLTALALLSAALWHAFELRSLATQQHARCAIIGATHYWWPARAMTRVCSKPPAPDRDRR